MTPFCDFLNVSVPLDHVDDLTQSLRPVLDAACFEIVRDERGGFFYRIDSGTVKLHQRSRVVVVGASGAALHALRSASMYGDYLSCLSALPHRVTRIDCTLDLPCDAAPFVSEFAARGRKGEIALSRKSILPDDVLTYLSLDDRSVMTGSVYLGSYAAKVRGVVYDKRWQMLKKFQREIGPTTRVELRINGEIGPTLADAWCPAKLFWHFASPDLLEAPPGTMPWSSHAEGFTLPPRTDLTAAELMQRRLDTSPDVARLLMLAQQCGPHGIDLLCARLRKLAGSAPGPGAGHAVGGASLPPPMASDRH